jgi:uncharacterized membrane protein
MVVLLGLVAAVCYGASDFIAGLGGRRTSVGAVVILGQPFALLVTVIALVVVPGSGPTTEALIWGAVSGIGGGLGTLALYRGLAVGQMSLVAPLSAVLTALVPAAVGLGLGDRLSLIEGVGIACAVPAILLVSAQGRSVPIAASGVLDGIAAGAGFGLLLVALDQAGSSSGAWPLVPGQIVAFAVITPLALRMKHGITSMRRAFPYGATAGVLGGAATLSFLTATGKGRLALVAVLTAMYPAVTVILARLMLSERWTRSQVAGLLAAAAAVGLMSAG